MPFFVMFPAFITVVAGFECPGGRLTPQQRIDIVNQHNEFRSLLIHGKLKNKDNIFMPRGKNMLQMTWSCQLEISAQKWADQCIFRHSSRKQREGIGENLYAYWSSANVEKFRDIAGTDAGKSWWSELPQLYTDNPSNILTPEVYSQGVSHFTQMAWGNTHEIGCGIATKCEGGRSLIVICHYSPRGNWLRHLIYELGEPCKTDSDCDTEKCLEESGLCEK
ncbi:SCP-like extracellular protein [Brugia malayi]|uniref:Bm5569, isoform a; Bm5569, isoform b n=3 Tax=Brugia malayi TaxID=6279 RepID=A0A4E9F2G2_BRUMA|nr:SCP-like extracellular protein [Brugia malayi]VIO90429.1 SCP-like extracellular protein [Brugia malayi]